MEQLETKTEGMEEAKALDLAEETRKAEELYTQAMDKLNSYRLDWTFRSIEYIINKENMSFSQLRSCVYIQDGVPVFNYIKSTILIIKAGLVGSKQIEATNDEALESRAYEIAEEWRAEFTSINTLHLLLIHLMETKHFFMGTEDMKIIQHLSSRNLQKDLGVTLLKEDIEERTRQAQALQQNF